MKTLYIHHPASLDHKPPSGHPERPDRIRAIDRALEQERFQDLVRELAPEGDSSSVLLAHPEA
jgi:acetoin utilization deacetylase AcuC-like enzyme